MLVFSIIFICLAAISNAVMDNIKDHWYKSVFNSKRFNRQWWDPELGWQNKYKVIDIDGYYIRNNIPVQVSDAWHLFKSLMIIFLCASIVTYKPLFGLWDILIFGTVWNATFSLFYNWILISKI
jgi:hypothetical protein